MRTLKLVKEVSAKDGLRYVIWNRNICEGVFRRKRPAMREYNRIKSNREKLGAPSTEEIIAEFND